MQGAGIAAGCGPLFAVNDLGSQAGFGKQQGRQQPDRSGADYHHFCIIVIHDTNSCSCSRTTSTGQGARRTTFSAVLPIKTCLRPVCPRVQMMMRSVLTNFANRTISSVGWPTFTSTSVSTPLGTWA